MRTHPLARSACFALLLAGCGSDDEGSAPGGGGTGVDAGDSDATEAGNDAGEDVAIDAPTDTGPDGPELLGPNEDLDRFCSEPWQQTLVPGTAGELSGEYLGIYPDLPTGTLLTMKVIPQHPMQVETLRVALAGTGTARFRVMKTFGRSYPELGGFVDDIVPVQELQVDEASPESWIEIDVSELGVYLEPTQHYVIVFEQSGDEPTVPVEDLPEGETSRALMLVPGESVPYGSEGNFRMELAGQFFCSWDESARWFGESAGQPFAEARGQYGAFADLNGDDHVDIVLNESGPLAFFGDGQGGFTEPPTHPFPDTPRHNLIVYGDIDNDGDVDAFAGANVSPDRDGDGVQLAEGDCDDSLGTVKPGGTEVPDNGLDDDCDGTVDDGTGVSDADADGVTIADGDCNDTREDVYPGADELLDGMDNDCDGEVEEDFINRILLNDGSGVLEAVPSAGVEVLDPSAAAAFGDANGDGALDLYWGNWLEHYPQPAAVPDVFALGNGDGSFVDTSIASGVSAEAEPCYGVVWNDYDSDGDQDIFVGNYGYGDNLLWTNDGTGQFEDRGAATGVWKDGTGFQGGNTFGGDFGDIDNDGDLDLYAANIAHPRYQPNSDISTLMINQGPPGFLFTEERAARGLIYDEGDVNAAFADFDNDGDLDLAVASLYPNHFSRLYLNDGTGNFTDVSYEANVAVNDSVSVAWADVDEDGDLDLLVVDRAGAERAHLFINRIGQDNAWIELDLRGTTSNRGGVGARVTLTAGGVTQIREVRAGGGHNVQNERIVHFGLGTNTQIDEVTVRWVGGNTETIAGLTPNQRYLVEQGSGSGQPL